MEVRRNLVQEFKPGDLIYGLSANRIEAINMLPPEKKPADHAQIVDQLNAITVAKLLDMHDRYDKTGVDLLISELKKGAIQFTTEQVMKHLNAISGPYPNEKHQKLSIKNGGKSEKNEKNLEAEQRVTRRACKSRLIDPEVKIHFILENIDIRHTFDRNYSLQNKYHYTLKDLHCPYDTYTSAELRFVLKHYEEVKDHITFYSKVAGQYVECNLFQWLNQHSVEACDALSRWAADRQAKGKIHENTIDRLRLVKGSTSASVEYKEASTPKIKASVPPPTPARKKMHQMHHIFQQQKLLHNHPRVDLYRPYPTVSPRKMRFGAV